MEHHNTSSSSSHDIVPNVYAACLASYNNSILHGKWIALDGSEDISESIQAMLKNSPIPDSEEWAIHDHEYCGELSEYAGIDTLENIQNAYTQVSSEGHDWELFSEFCDYRGDDLEPRSLEKFIESYAGSDDSLEAWCEEFLASTGELENIPSHLRFYFNLSAYARDLKANDVFTFRSNSKEHVFWQH